MRRWLSLALLALVLVGCSSGPDARPSEGDQELREENQRLAAEKKELEAQLDVLRQELGRLNQHVADLKAAVEARVETAAIPAKLISAHYLNPPGGTEAWTYRKRLSADLDGDGAVETVTVVTSAAVDPQTKEVAWDDGHIWHVYVDEPDGTRTVLFADWVQTGRLEVGLAMDERSLLLTRAGGWYTTIYRASYRGPNQVDAVELVSVEWKEKAEWAD